MTILIKARQSLLRLIPIVILLSLITAPTMTQAANQSINTLVPNPVGTSVFINEIHYDNDSTDTGEAVEIAGPAGTDLSSWTVVLYNGNGGAQYATISLSGTIPNQDDGYGTQDFAHAGIQNGAPDGLALVDSSSTVVQFLSYEGTFTATDGPANGMSSTDIGVQELSTTPVGNSLQLTGTGMFYEDFTWASPVASTFASVNTGQDFDGGTPVLDDPIINEFVANHTGTDTHEFVEVFGTSDSDYSAFTIVEIEGDSPSAGLIDDVIINVGSTDANGFWVSSYMANLIENGTLTLLLVENFTGSTGTDLDTNDDGTFDSTPWSRIVDDVAVNDGDAGDVTYSSTVLQGGFDGVSYDVGGASRIPNGTDTDAVSDWVRNDFDGGGLPGFTGTPVYGEAYNTPGAANSGVIPDVVINEADADTSGTDTLEFVELYDGGVGNIALDGRVVVFYNGNGDVSYNAFDLDSYSTDTNGYFVLGNTAVSGVDLVFSSNGLQNGADAIALYEGDATDFPNGTAVTTANLIDAIVYDTDDDDDAGLLVLLNAGQPQVNEGGKGNTEGHSNQRCPNGTGGLRNTDTYDQYSSTPDGENTCTIGVGFGICGDPATYIHTIQGSGTSSPEDGNTHVVEGVVVGDFQDTSTELSGFFLQEEDSDVDTDPLTSEGLFVYDNGFGTDVSEGELVRVIGEVDEHYGLTQLTSISNLAVCGLDTATAASISLPVVSLDNWENTEGMLVSINQTLYATDNYSWGRYGEVELSVNSRLFNPTNVVLPGAPAIALQDLNDRNRIQMDDGSRVENPLPFPPYLGINNTLRAGDTIPNLIGVLSYDYGSYEIHPTGTVTFTPTNPRTVRVNYLGLLKVASFNVLNYFTTIDTGADICGPSGNMECRGADSPVEFTRQRDKIISAISGMDADVVGLIEIENNATAAIQDLVNGLNAVMGVGTYDFIDTGTIGTDAIKVALIYKPANVTPVGTYAILDQSVDATFNDGKNRPVLAQTFMDNAGEKLTVAVNHLKSKGSPCDDVGDPDIGDGQGNCNLTRKSAAIAEVNWLASDPTSSGDPDFIIIGDLNAYAKEDPVTAIKDGGYTDLVNAYESPIPYSYVYYGQAGYVDHALSSPRLTAQVIDTGFWHINADEPSALDYNDYNQPSLYATHEFRSSDHDPVITYLDLGRIFDIFMPLIMKN